jgi:uncharacterized phage protein (TIGR01671 family)
MRIIKFRAWDKKLYKMIPHEELSPQNNKLVYGRRATLDSILLHDDYEIMQFTGIQDKNNKCIYEGDIVRILYTDWPSKSDDDPRTLEQYLIDISITGKIVFEENGWALSYYSKKYDDWGFSSLDYGKHGFIEIIGNIYENPELI